MNYLNRAGLLSPAGTGSLHWTDRHGEPTGSINLHMRERYLRLSYRCQVNDGEWEDIEENVPIQRVPCRYGGQRPYFECPGSHCGRRVAKLFGADKYFLCRHCYRIAYASQSEGPLDRAIRRANKIREQLGGERGGVSAPIPPRPKGMWYRTYERSCAELHAAQIAGNIAFLRFSKSLMAQIKGQQRPVKT